MNTEQEQRLHFLLKKLNLAHRLYRLIEEGDRIAVGVSSGKDSLTLLLFLQYFQKHYPLAFELGAVHIEPDFQPGHEERRCSLEKFLERYQLPFASLKMSLGDDSVNCFWCSWNRRKMLFRYAYNHGYNKVALGHQFDDVVETALLNLFFHAVLETMEPKVIFFDGKVTLIRPLVFIEEKEIIPFARTLSFPLAQCQCPYAETSRRAAVQKLLKGLGKNASLVKHNIWKATRKWLEAYPQRAHRPEHSKQIDLPLTK